MTRPAVIDLADLEELVANPAIPAVRRAAERGMTVYHPGPSTSRPAHDLIHPTLPPFDCTTPFSEVEI